MRITAVLFLLATGVPAQDAHFTDDRSDTWIHVVPPLGQAPGACDMVLDPAGHPVICYDPLIGGDIDGLYFVTTDGLWWTEVLVTPLQYSSTGCSMALDPSGHPRILYLDSYWNDLEYAWSDGGTWSTETVHPDCWGSLDLELDPEGIPHASFVDRDGYAIIHAVREEDGWTSESLGTAGTWSTAMAVDGEGRPHVIWDEGLPIVHAWKEEDGWHRDTVDTYRYAEELALLCDEGGTLHAVLQGGPSGGLVYYRNPGSGWSEEAVDPMGGDGCDLAVGPDGTVHIAYDEGVNSDLRYARREPGGGWQHWVISWEGWNAQTPAIDVDAQGNPHIFHSRLVDGEWVHWGTPTGLEEPSAPAAGGVSLSVRPVPVRGSATVSVTLPVSGPCGLTLYDLSGRRAGGIFEGILPAGSTSLAIDARDLPAGTYHLVLTTGDLILTERLLLLP